MNFNYFVIPFTFGFFSLIIILLFKYFKWISTLSSNEYKKIIKGLFSVKSGFIIKEIFSEALLHRRIFKYNALLGYMHMSFAFGWFLLILAGAIEVRILKTDGVPMIYEAIFLKYFFRDMNSDYVHDVFNFINDFLLLAILIGLFLALFKRIRSRFYGLKKSAKQLNLDRIALTSLWFIFPLRLLAESATTSIYQNGGFLTQTLGDVLFLQNEYSYFIMMFFWWAYSIVLCVFFIVLPFSRYMHIPTEIFLIAFRKFGIKTQKAFDGFSKFEINSCSNCGICTDNCQLNFVLKRRTSAFPYFARQIRVGKYDESIAFNCLMCGRCLEYCPVNINTLDIRMLHRKEFFINDEFIYDFIPDIILKSEKIGFYAGCMGHLSPNITNSFFDICKEAKINCTFIDEEKLICCGRPLLLSGNVKQAEALIRINKTMIENSGLKTLVVSCPICYNMFKDNYNFKNINVLHHSEYILKLVKSNRIKLNLGMERFSNHIPCELGRIAGLGKIPSQVIENIGFLNQNEKSANESLCCGGSLADFELNSIERDKITSNTLEFLSKDNPSAIITSCPLCKKTLARISQISVLDIAELVAKNMVRAEHVVKEKKDKLQKVEYELL